MVKETRRSCARSPSAVIPAKINYLLKPLHSDFRRIGVGARIFCSTKGKDKR